MVDPLADSYHSFSPYAYVGNDPVNFTDPTGMYRVDAMGNISITSTNEIGLALQYISSPDFNVNNFASYVKDAANGFSYELDDVTITSQENNQIVSLQNTAADRYSNTNGNVNIGSFNNSLKTTSSGERIIEGIHSGLDLAGLIPGLGEIADGTNALVYLAQADYLNASISLSAMIPFAGSVPTGTRLGVKAAKGGTTVFKTFTKSNFRHNLGQLTGNISTNSQAHHVFPQKFQSIFSSKGINIHDPKFGAWWNTSGYLKCFGV